MCYINNAPERTRVQICASCSAEEISHLLSVAIKDENSQLANQLLDSLAGLSRSDLIVQALVETINNETIEYNSGIYTIVIGAIANYIYLPGLRDVWNNIYSCKTPPITVEELLKGTKFAECERFASQDGEAKHDGRLDEFLKSLSNKGTVSATMGYKIIKDGTDTRRNSIPETESDQCNFKIVDGVLSEEDARRILSYLDIMGIKEALPTFCGDWETFVLKDGTWEPYTGGEKCNKMFFFTCDSYSSVNR